MMNKKRVKSHGQSRQEEGKLSTPVIHATIILVLTFCLTLYEDDVESQESCFLLFLSLTS